MAYYHVHGIIPDAQSQTKGYKIFGEYINSGASKDNFDGFAIISRVHAPQTGEVFITCIADNHFKVDEHFAIWRERIGVNWNIVPVLSDEEILLRNRKIAEESFIFE